ncbi:MAG: hypothetical protein RLY97_1666 [Pseudomonadota bacterium]
MNRVTCRSLLACGASAIALMGLASPVLAQSATTKSTDKAATSADASRTETSEIIVTGSLISRRDYKSESPISTIDVSAIKAAGSPSLDGVLGQMPQFAAGQGASNSNPTVQGGGLSFAGGQSYSDLRGLGPNRSLVLLDGRRLMSSAPSGAIDLNEIPTALIDNVEVITGGASAAYGSDAVAGVVNFKLKKNFSGVELDIQHGATTKGDGATNQFSGIIGGSFNEGRGHAMLAFGYANRATVLGASRPFFTDTRELARPPEGMINPGNYAGGAPTIAAVNAVLAGYSGTTPIAGSGTYSGSIGVNNDGTIFTTKAAPNCVQNYRGLGTVTGVNIGNGDLDSRCYKVQVALGQLFNVQVPLTKYNVFANADYELNDHVTTYGQFNFMESSATDVTGPGSSKESGSLTLQLPVSNPFVQGNAALMSILNSGTPAAAAGTLRVTALLTPFGNRVETFKYDVWQALIGFKGDIAGTSLKWNAYGSLGHSQFINNTAGDASISAITAMLNGTANYTGSAGTCKGYAWNPLGNHALSPGCLEYAGRTDHNVNTQTMKTVEATLAGPLFRLPAGDASFALGADYRETSFNYQPDNALITADSLPFGSISAASGKQKVKEVFGELLIPLLKDQPFAKDLSLDLGYRYSKYNTFSGQSTWKADLSWSPVDQVRFRGGYSRAIRAPSLEDLFGPTTNAQVSIGNSTLAGLAGDPCDINSSYRNGANAASVKTLCLAQGVPAALINTYTYGSPSVQGTSGSNATLTPEKANTWSVGVVIAPKFSGSMFRNFQISVDYYNIKISNAVGSLNLTDILPRCFNSDGVSNTGYSVSNAYCQRIQRDVSGGAITSSQQGLFNFATYTVSGIDTQLNWKFGLGESPKSGKIAINSVISYLKNYKVAGLFGSPTLNYAGSIGYDPGTGDISHPKWKANTNVTYSNGGFSGTLRWRYIGAMKHVDQVVNPAATTVGVSAFSYFDFDMHYAFNEHLSIGAGVTNLSDKSPPYVSAASLRTDSALYDIIGRTWFLSAKVKF